MASNSETEINLKTVQRVDCNIVEIIDSASQVAVYTYERKFNKWEYTDIQGALFLFRRSLHPFHGFIIVNRMSTTNFVEDITNDMELELREPYLMYTKSCGKIICSWFYEKKDFRRITNKIQSIVLKQTSPPKRQRCSSDSDSQLKKDDAVQDILSMLSEAHSQYNKTDLDNLVPEKNIEEDFNDVTTYCDKKLNDKLLNASGNKSKSPCVRSSSEEKYHISPRHRFLSSGSYPTHSPPLSSNKILNELVSSSKETNVAEIRKECKAKGESCPDGIKIVPFELGNVESSLVPTKISQLFSHEEIPSSFLSGVRILDQTVESFEFPWNTQFTNPVILNVTQKNTSSDASKLNDKEEYNVHLSGLKGTLISHLEWGSDIMLKIHEAYVASLKSVFTQEKKS